MVDKRCDMLGNRQSRKSLKHLRTEELQVSKENLFIFCEVCYNTFLIVCLSFLLLVPRLWGVLLRPYFFSCARVHGRKNLGCVLVPWAVLRPLQQNSPFVWQRAAMLHSSGSLYCYSWGPRKVGYAGQGPFPDRQAWMLCNSPRTLALQNGKTIDLPNALPAVSYSESCRRKVNNDLLLTSI